MNTTKISDSDIIDLRISSLPSRPTAPAAFGGKGFTASDMKAAFDKLPLYIIERFNSLLDDIASADENSLAAEIPTSISEDHTLRALFEDITSGSFAAYLSLGDETLAALRERLAEERADADEKLELCLLHIADEVIDGASPKERSADSGEVVA